MAATVEIDQEQQPKGRTWVKVFLGLCCVLVALMWGYYLFFADGKGVYRLQDTTWREKAIPICEAARTQREALADTGGGIITEPTLEQMRERADLVDQSTDIVETMLDDIMAIPVDNDRDRQILAVFENRYRMVIADRRRYAEQLRNGENVDYTETVDPEAGGPVSNVVFDFTAGVKSNNVPECSPPTELSSIKTF